MLDVVQTFLHTFFLITSLHISFPAAKLNTLQLILRTIKIIMKNLQLVFLSHFLYTDYT